MNATAAATINPVEIDNRIADLADAVDKATKTYVAAADHAHTILGERKVYRGRTRVWPTSGVEALDEVAARLEAGAISSHERATATRTLARAEEARATIARVQAEIDPLEDLYREHRWSRFITVERGHIHSGRVCAGGTIRPTTRIGWNPDLSGSTEADAVATLGPTLCTHCFPSAPVEWTQDPSVKAADPNACPFPAELNERERGQYNPLRYSPSVTCECGKSASVTSTGKKRKHARGPNAPQA